MQFTLRIRNLVYLATATLAVWFLFAYKEVFTPFLIAMIFAYVFNPLINLFNHKLRVNRAMSIVIVYLILIVSTVAVITLVTRSILAESQSITRNFGTFSTTLQKEVAGSPDFLKFFFADYLEGFPRNQIPNTLSFPLFTRAFSGVINLFIFLFAAFFFLKDGRRMTERLIKLFPSEYKNDVEELLRKINVVLSSYLRGQIILILAMMVMLYSIFTILGVKNALTLSLMSAIFEIVPFIGPIVAAILGTFIIIISGGIANFQIPILQSVLILLAIYAITRYIQDYAIAPFVIGKATHLHPLIILFSVIVGEHLYGILGVILAVPVAASIKILYVFFFEKLSQKDKKSLK